MILDSSEELGDYVEDCEVCCRPIEIHFDFSGETLTKFEAVKMEGI
jgi:hypothetical protein